MGFFSSKKTVLGVDIGTENVKITQITQDGSSKPVLDTFGIVKVSGFVNPKDSENSVSQAAEILRTLVAESGVTTKKVVASLPNNAVFTSVLDMPLLSENELASALQFEAKKYIPLAVNEVSLSWSIVSKDDVAKTCKVLLIAVPMLVRSNYIKIFQEANLDLRIIEIEALALIRSILGDNTQGNCVIVDIGSKNTGLNLIERGLLQLTRNLNIGGDAITEKIAQTLNVSKERAEQFKKDYGLSSSEFVPESLKPTVLLIKNEAKQIINIFQSQGNKVDKIWFTGGGSSLPGLGEFMSDLSIPIEIAHPAHALKYPPELADVIERFEGQLACSIGLAKRGID